MKGRGCVRSVTHLLILFSPYVHAHSRATATSQPRGRAVYQVAGLPGCTSRLRRQSEPPLRWITDVPSYRRCETRPPTIDIHDHAQILTAADPVVRRPCLASVCASSSCRHRGLISLAILLDTLPQLLQLEAHSPLQSSKLQPKLRGRRPHRFWCGRMTNCSKTTARTHDSLSLGSRGRCAFIMIHLPGMLRMGTENESLTPGSGCRLRAGTWSTRASFASFAVTSGRY